MVSIFAKARICLGNTQVYPQFFCISKLQLTQKGQAAMQMDCSSASSKILFHRLPSKSKCPSIRKQSVVVIITVNSIRFYETAIRREIFSKYFFASIFVNFQKILTAHQLTFRKKFQKLHKNSPMAKSYVSKVAGFYRGSHRKHSVKKVFLERCLQNSQEKTCVRLYFNKVAFLRL